MENVLKRIVKVKHGFKPIEREAKKIFELNLVKDCIALAKDFLRRDAYQIRCLAVFLLGYCASQDKKALHILKTKVSKDTSWQVQEILAKAFDHYCKEIGYENSLPVIKSWLNDTNPNICRAVTEGLRIWTNRPFFKENPKLAIDLISQHRSSESNYLRKSVGNALRDISKKYNNLIENELSKWDLSDTKVNFTYKRIVKNIT